MSRDTILFILRCLFLMTVFVVIGFFLRDITPGRPVVYSHLCVEGTEYLVINGQGIVPKILPDGTIKRCEP